MKKLLIFILALFIFFLIPSRLFADESNNLIIIDTFKRRLHLMADDKIIKSYPVAIGKVETPTPIGNWYIPFKAKDWGTGFGTRFLALNVPWGKYGIHGTNKPGSIGNSASHGCIRMFNRDVEDLFSKVPTNTEVIVIGNPFNPLGYPWRTIFKGHKGSDVVEVQDALRRKGYYKDKSDGIFGWGTESALIKFQKDTKLEPSGQVGIKEYEALGLILKREK